MRWKPGKGLWRPARRRIPPAEAIFLVAGPSLCVRMVLTNVQPSTNTLKRHATPRSMYQDTSRSDRAGHLSELNPHSMAITRP